MTLSRSASAAKGEAAAKTKGTEFAVACHGSMALKRKADRYARWLYFDATIRPDDNTPTYSSGGG